MSADSRRPSFLDTNILVYAIADDDPKRTPVARELMRSLADTRSARTSTQVLQELYVTVTRKVERRLSHEDALRYLDELATWPVTLIDYTKLRAAAVLSASHRLSFWDGLIVVTAAASGAERLYTEDLQDGQKLLGVEIVNPFRRATSPSAR